MSDSSADMPTRFLKDVINPWMLGADPEFAVLTPPDTPVPNSGTNAVNTTMPAGQIGFDHSGRVWELRPTPSPSAYMVTVNLWKLLLQQEMNKLEKFKWKSGALGGRKASPGHIGSPYLAANAPTTLQGWIDLFEQPLYGYGNNQAAIQQAAQQALDAQQQAQQQATAFDTLGGHVHFGIAGLNGPQRAALNDVTTGLLNLDILPHKENTKRLSLTNANSPDTRYGHIDGSDATRNCQGHIEYRCAPSWLDKPGQALAALTCYKLAAARPSSLKWPKEFSLKSSLLDWLEQLSSVDIDAWWLFQYITACGFTNIQADPSSDFKPQWRKERLWEP